MIAEIGKVKRVFVGKNKDGDKDVVLLECELSTPEDIQTVELYNLSGDDSSPVVGAKVIVVSLGAAWKIGIAIKDDLDPESLPGEKILYSHSDEGKRTKIHLKNNGEIDIESISGAGAVLASIVVGADGVIKINGQGDNAVRFSALLAAFEALKSELTSHKHLGVVIGSEISGLPEKPFVASMLAAKIESIEVPSL